MAIADELADFPLQVMSRFFVGLVYVYACRFRQSVEPFNWNLERLQGEMMRKRLRAISAMGEPGLPAIFTRSYLMRALAELGDFDAALARGDEAVRLSELTDYPFSQALCLEGLGSVHLRRGQIRQAIVVLEQGLDICNQWQLHLNRYVIQAYLGYAYALLGRDEQAAPLLAESLLSGGSPLMSGLRTAAHAPLWPAERVGLACCARRIMIRLGNPRMRGFLPRKAAPNFAKVSRIWPQQRPLLGWPLAFP